MSEATWPWWVLAAYIAGHASHAFMVCLNGWANYPGGCW